MQALLELYDDAKIYLVDPQAESLNVCEQRWNEVRAENELLVYFQHSNDLLPAEMNAQSNASVALCNTLGQLGYRISEYKNKLNINKLLAATYFYEVKYGNNTYRGKLMVIR